MQTVLIIIHLLIAIALILTVLLQRSEGGALGIGGGGSGSGLGGLFSPRGAASTLTRTTAILGLLFICTSLSLTYLSLGARAPVSIFEQGQAGTPLGGAPPILPPGGPPQLPGAAPPQAPVGEPPALPAAPPAN